MKAIISLVCGAMFGAGVCISGMVRPSKVLGFLDFGGAWDPSLAVVLGTALSIHILAWRLVRRATRPRFGASFPPPPSSTIDRRLVGGAVLFGAGWGLSGYCPGPAVVAIVSGVPAALVFLAAMAGAMVLYRQSTGSADG